MAWKRLFHTLKKIFSHNQPPIIARRVYCHCAPSSRQNTRSVILRSNRRSAVYPVQSQMFHVKQNVRSNEQVFGVTLRANVRLLSHKKYKYKMRGKKQAATAIKRHPLNRRMVNYQDHPLSQIITWLGFFNLSQS